MKTSSLFEPVSAPHRTKRFWIFVALWIVLMLAAPVVQRSLGLPLFPLRAYVISGAVTFAFWAIAWWCIFRFGGIAFLAVGVALIVFAFWARSHG